MAAERHTEEMRGVRIERRLRAGVVLVLLVVFSFVAWQAGAFQLGARLFPEYVGIAGITLCALELARQLLRRAAADAPAELNTADLGLEAEDRTPAGYMRALWLFGWILAYHVLIWLAGMMAATLLFVPALLRLQYRAPWTPSLSIAAGLVVLVWLLEQLLGMRSPAGVLPLLF